MFQIKSNINIWHTTICLKNVFTLIRSSLSTLSENNTNNNDLESIQENRDTIGKQIICLNEEVSSYVRFNRDIISPQPNQFTHLLRHDMNNTSTQLKIQLICAEYEYIAQTSGQIPNQITSDRMKQLLSCSASHRRQLFYKWYLSESQPLRNQLNKIVSSNNNNESSNKLVKQTCDHTKQIEIFDANGNLNYVSNGNTIAKVRRDKTRRNIAERYRVSTLLGQHLVIDFNSDYETFVHEKKIRFGFANITRLYGNNIKRYTYPYNLHFCNINTSSVTYELLTNCFNKPVIDLMANVTNKSYLDIFEHNDRQNMILVTSLAHDVITDFDENSIYIMSPLLELHSRCDNFQKRRIQAYLSHKIVNEGIRIARLPLKEYANITCSLLIHNYVDILNDMKMGKQWQTAIRDNVSNKLLDKESDRIHDKSKEFLIENT